MAETSLINRMWWSLELRHPKSGNVSPSQKVSPNQKVSPSLKVRSSRNVSPTQKVSPSQKVSPCQKVSQLGLAGWSVISEELEFVFDVVLVAFLTVARNHFAEEACKEEKHADDQSDQ